MPDNEVSTPTHTGGTLWAGANRDGTVHLSLGINMARADVQAMIDKLNAALDEADREQATQVSFSLPLTGLGTAHRWAQRQVEVVSHV